MEKRRNPKMETPANVQISFILKDNKPYASGENEYGKWFAYNVIHEGMDKIYFAKEYEHEQLQAYEKGASLTILKREEKKDGKWIRQTVITQPMFDNTGKPSPPEAPDLMNDPLANEIYRNDWKTKMLMCLKDAHEVVNKFNESLPNGMQLSSEDMRAIAISHAISFERATK